MATLICRICGHINSDSETSCEVCGALLKGKAPETTIASTDARQLSSLERNSIVACCGLSLLLFFFPLLTIQIPIAGDQDVSGYDVVSKLTEFREKLKPPDPTSTSSPTARTPPPLPLSIQLGWLLPLMLIVAFLSAAIAFIAAFKAVQVTRVMCVIGACCSAAVIVHITIMNSDIHSWLSESMKATREDLKGNPFAGLAENLSSLMVNAFQIKPGWGVFGLLFLLALAAVLAYSRILSRLRVVPG